MWRLRIRVVEWVASATKKAVDSNFLVLKVHILNHYANALLQDLKIKKSESELDIWNCKSILTFQALIT